MSAARSAPMREASRTVCEDTSPPTKPSSRICSSSAASAAAMAERTDQLYQSATKISLPRSVLIHPSFPRWNR
jgi:hypothetical protein